MDEQENSMAINLNNVGGRVAATMDEKLRLVERMDGSISVLELLGDGLWETGERYVNQSAFATICGLHQGN